MASYVLVWRTSTTRVRGLVLLSALLAWGLGCLDDSELRISSGQPGDVLSDGVLSAGTDREPGRLPETSVLVGAFEGLRGDDGLPGGWRVKTFDGVRATRFALRRGDDGSCIEAVAEGGAALLVREIDIDLKKLPRLSWKWRVTEIPKAADVRKKEGDDCAARLFISFAYDPSSASAFERIGRSLYDTNLPGTALNYIWSRKLPRGQSAPSAFTEKTQMIAIRCGPEGQGQWVTEERNVYQDYLTAFGKEPPKVIGVAIMADADQTGGRAAAQFDDIVFHAGE